MLKLTGKIGWIMMAVALILITWGQSNAGIGMRDGGSVGRDGDFVVEFEPVKPVFNAGEPIRFKVMGNKTFYLYLFSIDEKANRGYVLLPNLRQQYNKYKANTEYNVPEKNIEFFSDNPGTEKIIMLASTKKLDVKMDKYTKAGNFMSSNASDVEQETKALRVRSRDQKAQRVSQELSLVIVGKADDAGGNRDDQRQPPPAADRQDSVSTFISSDKTEYGVGDTIVISYGADKEGYIHLFSVEPDGKRTFLKTQKVTGKKFYQVRAKAAAPGGVHKLVAIYGKERNLKEGSADALNLEEAGKAVRLIDEGPDSYAVYTLTVNE